MLPVPHCGFTHVSEEPVSSAAVTFWGGLPISTGAVREWFVGDGGRRGGEVGRGTVYEIFETVIVVDQLVWELAFSERWFRCL